MDGIRRRRRRGAHIGPKDHGRARWERSGCCRSSPPVSAVGARLCWTPRWACCSAWPRRSSATGWLPG